MDRLLYELVAVRSLCTDDETLQIEDQQIAHAIDLLAEGNPAPEELSLSGLISASITTPAFTFHFTLDPTTYLSTSPLLASVTVPPSPLEPNFLPSLTIALESFCTNVVGEETIWDAFTFVKEHEALQKYLLELEALRQRGGPPPPSKPPSHPLTDNQRPQVSGPMRILLIKIDHMHDRKMYTRNIKTFAASTQCTGRLVFYERFILLLLHGSPEGIKEYLKLHRTETVDVDSRGRACRERMMDILVDSECPSGEAQCQFMTEFREVSPDSLSDVMQLLTANGISEVDARRSLVLATVS